VIAARDTVNLAWDTGKKRSCELTNLADGNGRVTTLGGDSVNENLPDIANGVANIISDMPGIFAKHAATESSMPVWQAAQGVLIYSAANGICISAVLLEIRNTLKRAR
jgi:hypothetical protein